MIMVKNNSILWNTLTTMILLTFLVVTSGCSAIMAARQPGFTDTSVLRKGASRRDIIMAFGKPITSETDKNGNLVEYYQFKQGYKTG